MSIDKGGLFRNRKFSDFENFYNPDIVSWMEPALAVRQAVNQTVGRFNIKEWTVNIEANIHDLNLVNLRSIKNTKEILNIKKACKITDEAFEYIIKKIKSGISEKEVAKILELFFQSKKVESGVERQKTN